MAATPNFNPRRLMEQAIEAMRQSRHEQRNDGKASPKVGAVLWHPDGTVQTAHRGELREGDHAEFTILERKNRDRGLDGCRLFATLEPCAPGSRGPHKTPCAERVVLARIKEVWVGIEDPDPTVDRKGIKYLQNSGVKVRMFDADLQKQIQAENRDFLAQAEARAIAAEDELAKPVELSSMEQPLVGASLAELSGQALAQFRTAVGLRASVDSPEFAADLARRGFASRQVEGFAPTGYGLLLFGKEPRAAIPQAGLLATIEYPDGKKEIRDFDGPLILLPREIENWLRDKLPNVVNRGSMRRVSVSPVPFEMLREAIVNALIHRDYDIKGAKCQLVVTADTITVRSPGRPVPPITLEQLRGFNAPMLSRNPALHYVFSRLGLAEERGLGLRSLRALAEENQLPLPTYTFQKPYLDLVIYRSSSAAVTALPAAVARQLKDDERAALEFISTRPSIVARDLEGHLDFDERKVQRILKRLIDLDLVLRRGKGRATHYEVRQP